MDNNNVGKAVKERIIDLCNTRGLTINRLSILCGITQSTLNNIVSGRNNSTTIATIKKICDGLDISLKELFDSPLFDALDQEIL